MPKTTVDKDGGAVPRQNNVRLTWQVGPVQTVAKSKLVETFPDDHFRVGVAGSNPRHVPTPMLC